MGKTVGEVWENYAKVDVLLGFIHNMEDSSEAAENVMTALCLFVKYGDGDVNKGKMNPDWSPWLWCLQNVHTISFNTESVNNIYHLTELNQNMLWLNGPNC